jgi:hypothetical protein
MRDDRVLTGTRVLGAVIVPFLLVAFGLLYLFPTTRGTGSPGTCSRRSRL